MRKTTLSILAILFCAFYSTLKAQITYPGFGKGLQIMAPDSSLYMKVGFRFQTLYENEWENNDNHASSFSIRRSRLKFSGWAVSPKLKYKCELAISNRDNGGGNSSRYSNAANIILDAYVNWNFYKGLSIWAGQGKLPGNRERLISSGNLQFVNRSALNSKFTLDRDVGIMLLNKHKIGDQFILRETFAVSMGEGKNITAGNLGGYAYTFKIEMLPFGKFQSKGDYIGSAIKREDSPKLAIAFSYDINSRAARTRGHQGSFLLDENGESAGKDLRNFLADLMFKYKDWSVMMEMALRDTNDKNPEVYALNGEYIGSYYTGWASSFAAGYMMPKNWEVALRMTSIRPDELSGNKEDHYTIGLSKYIVGHKLKVQTDLTRSILDDKDDLFLLRMQIDIHF